MTVAVVLLIILTTLMSGAVVYLFIALRKTEKKVDEVLDGNARARMEAYQEMVRELDASIASQQVTLAENTVLFENLRASLADLPEPLKDPEAITTALNSWLERRRDT